LKRSKSILEIDPCFTETLLWEGRIMDDLLGRWGGKMQVGAIYKAGFPKTKIFALRNVGFHVRNLQTLRGKILFSGAQRLSVSGRGPMEIGLDLVRWCWTQPGLFQLGVSKPFQLWKSWEIVAENQRFFIW